MVSDGLNLAGLFSLEYGLVSIIQGDNETKDIFPLSKRLEELQNRRAEQETKVQGVR